MNIVNNDMKLTQRSTSTIINALIADNIEYNDHGCVNVIQVESLWPGVIYDRVQSMIGFKENGLFRADVAEKVIDVLRLYITNFISFFIYIT